MKQTWMKLCVIVLLAALLLFVLPGAAMASEAVIGYGRATVDGVNVRKLADRNADAWFQIDTGYVCEVLGTRQSDNVSWYKVRCEKPQSSTHNTYIGYVLAKNFYLMTDAECEEWLKNPVQPGGSMVIVGDMATGQLTSSQVNVREKADVTSPYMFKLDRGVVVQLLSIPAAGDTDPWYKIKYNGYVGYIKGDFIKVLSTGNLVPGESATEAPAVSTPVGYVKTTTSGVNMRMPAGGEFVTQIPSKNVVLPYYLTSVVNSKLYYYASYGSYNGYVSAEYVTQCDVKGNPISAETDVPTTVPTATPVPTTAPTAIPTATPIPTKALGYVKTTMSGGVNVRAEAGGSNNVVTTVSKKDVVMPYYGTVYDGKVQYYYVAANGVRGWVHGGYVGLCKADGSELTGSTAAPTSQPAGSYGYAWTTKVKVRVWDKAGTGAKMIDRIENKGTVVPMRGDAVQAGGYTWYPITYGKTAGYLRGDASAKLTPAQQAAYEAGLPIPDAAVTTAPTAAPTSAPTTVPTKQPTAKPAGGYGYAWTTMVKVRVFDKPNGSMIDRIEEKGTVVPLTGPAETTSNGYIWYPIQYGKTRGYLRYVSSSPSCAKLTPAQQAAYEAGLPIPDASATAAPTAVPTATPVPTAAPTAVPTATPTVVPGLTTYGFARTTMVKVRVWDKASDSGAKQIDRIEKKDTIVPMTGTAQRTAAYIWYPVQYGTTRGYLRVDPANPNSVKLTPEQEAAYLKGDPVPTVTTAPTAAPAVASRYLITILNDVNLRVSASKSAESVAKYNAGKVMAYDSLTTSGGESWYRVIDNNRQLWVLATSVRVMSQAEYLDYIAANPQNTPQADIILGYVKTTTNAVNVRKDAKSGSSILGQVKSGSVYAYSEVKKDSSYTYYLVNTEVGKGYIRDTAVALCDAKGNVSPAITANPGVAPTTAPTVKYPVLRLGSTGAAVTNLVTALKKQGYYVGEVISSYNSAVRSAVLAFQKANGLSVDGIAGQETQTALYGTTVIDPDPGEQGGEYVVDGMTIYPAEKIDWFKGGIQQIWAKGASYKVYDVYTGIVWTARYLNGAYHADVEPLTSADTDRLCRIYGVSKASQINAKDHWYRRPCLVTIGNRTFACSLYGVPHGDDDGAIKDNDLYGVLCLHFSNSKVHNSSQVDPDHQAAIEYAYQHAPNGQKK